MRVTTASAPSRWGGLKFTLHSGSYDLRFVPVAGQTYNDSGTSNCH
ncbi:hypothetical protein JOD64_004737 [Micromonospora luteifusca]|uniref:Uncharacterized protein n=1 Tax=Micromonospora luteifusca TaxID=709860 RepID=A0ABS2LZC4_9ACTN|nr:hypothetical protein [Micromonospora luteifusca]MBM7493515.1 hypothetical protein [Micromonospora luteifusca]